MKQSFKFINKDSHQIGPSYISDKFGLPEQTKEILCWVHNTGQLLELLPLAEWNILLPGDPEQKFDLFSYIWYYSKHKIAAQNPALQAYFQHILQFEDNFEGHNLDNDHLDNQPIHGQLEEQAQPQPVQDHIEKNAQPQPVQPQQWQPARRSRPPKQKEEDPEYIPKSVISITDPNYIARHTRARRPDEFPHEPFGVPGSIVAVETNLGNPSFPDGQWIVVEGRSH